MNTQERITASLTGKGFAHLRDREGRMLATFCQTVAPSGATSPLSDLQSQGSR